MASLLIVTDTVHMTEDHQTEFGRQLKAHRLAAKLTQERAAELGGLSVVRWRQYERGYADNPNGRQVARPFAHNVGAIAKAVNWNRYEALVACGYNPADYPEEPETPATVPQVINDSWPHLSKKWQDIITDLVLEASRQATRPDARAYSQPVSKSTAPTPLFSSTEEPVVVEAPKPRTRRR